MSGGTSTVYQTSSGAVYTLKVGVIEFLLIYLLLVDTDSFILLQTEILMYVLVVDYIQVLKERSKKYTFCGHIGKL